MLCHNGARFFPSSPFATADRCKPLLQKVFCKNLRNNREANRRMPSSRRLARRILYTFKSLAGAEARRAAKSHRMLWKTRLVRDSLDHAAAATT